MTIEEIQAYWDRRPCNIRHSSVSIDEHPKLFSQEVSLRKYLIEPHIPSFANFSHWDKCSVLELGCGIGTDALSFAAHGARVWALDISGKSLEIARKRAVALGLQNSIMFFQGDMEDFEFADGILIRRFDLVYCFGALHHTPDPSRALACIERHLKPDGELRLMLYHRYTPKVLSALVHHWRPGMTIDDAVAQMSEAQAGSPLTRTYTRSSAAELLQGFEILDMHVDHIFPYRIADYVQYRYVLQWYWRILPPKLFRFLEQKLGWHLLITARLEDK